MKLTRLVVRLSALGVAAILTLPFVIQQVEAFGTTDDAAFPARTTERTAPAVSDGFIGAAPELAADATAKREARAETVTLPPLNDAPTTQPAPTAPASAPSTRTEVASEPVATSPTVVFDRKVSVTQKKIPKWTSKVITAEASGTAELELEWSGKAMLRIAVRDAKTDKWLAGDSSDDQPKNVTLEVEKGRKYKIAVWAMSGTGRFTVTMSGVESPGDPASDPPAPTPPDPEPPAPTPAPTGNGYPGEPANGTLYWGASIQGNGDPVSRHETAAGHQLTLRRTFWQWSQRTGSLVSTARTDIANGRLPWVSVKTPSWSSMAAGDHDAEIDEMLRALDALNGPVWLTIHHEPEGGGGSNSPDDPGGPSAHVEMNRRVRERMTALGTDNIALAPILMGWTFNSNSGRNPDEWWEPGIYDFLGVDHYQDSESSLLTTNWSRVRTWAAGKGVDIAVGEWGMRGTNAAAGERVRAWYNAAAGSHNDGKGARVVGLSAFDSGLNSPTGSWELKGGQLDAFRALLKDSKTANPQ